MQLTFFDSLKLWKRRPIVSPNVYVVTISSTHGIIAYPIYPPFGNHSLHQIFPTARLPLLKEVQLYHPTTPSIQFQLLKTVHSFFCPPPALNIDQSIMSTCQATGHERGCQQKEAQEVEHALQQKLDKQHFKRQQAKQLRNKEHKKEEEQRKILEDKQHKAKETAEKEAASAQLVPPSVEIAKAVSTTSILSIINGNVEEEGVDESVDNQSPVKNKPNKTSSTTAKSTALAKNKVKSALKASFSDSHVHNFPWVLAEASVTLKSETPAQEFIVNLQELLKNGQLVNRNSLFAQ